MSATLLETLQAKAGMTPSPAAETPTAPAAETPTAPAAETPTAPAAETSTPPPAPAAPKTPEEIEAVVAALPDNMDKDAVRKHLQEQAAAGTPPATPPEPTPEAKPETKTKTEKKGRGRPSKGVTKADRKFVIKACAEAGASVDTCREYLALIEEVFSA